MGMSQAGNRGSHFILGTADMEFCLAMFLS